MVHALAFLAFLVCAFAADFRVPELSGPVVDQAGLLSSSTKDSLDGFLRQFAQRGGAQVQVATVKDLGGLSIEEASIKITDQWKLGKKKEDRGVLLLIAASEHKVRIEVGQGLEGDLPDAVASRIINEVIVPRFREGSADHAVIDGVSAILHYTDPKLLDASEGELPAAKTHVLHKKGFGSVFTILFWLFILIMILRSRGGGGGLGGLVGYSLLGGGFGGGGYGGGSSGGSWSGGGGGFSGGGSSGSW